MPHLSSCYIQHLFVVSVSAVFCLGTSAENTEPCYNAHSSSRTRHNLCAAIAKQKKVGLALNGAEYRKRRAREVAASRAPFEQFKEHAESALSHGHDMTFEWPRYSDSWKRKDVQDFFQDSRFMSLEFDGCRFGVCDDKGQPLKKPWRLMTTSKDMVEAFKGLFC